MNPLWAIWAIPAIGFGIWGWYHRNRQKKRDRLTQLPWPASWEKILQSQVTLYRRLPSIYKKQLQGLIQIFLAEKRFEGCGGLTITEEMRIVIAAQACVLLLNRKIPLYPKLETILVYPQAFVAKVAQEQGWGTYVEKEQARLGESWHHGIVVLAWDHIKHESQDIPNGHNVVLHEFAHQLDQEDGRSDGTPLMENNSHYVSWSKHLGAVFEELQETAAKHLPSFIDTYGATNAAEFFAVITETFFEKSQGLKNKYPELYEELKTYYQLDPIQWRENS